MQHNASFRFINTQNAVHSTQKSFGKLSHKSTAKHSPYFENQIPTVLFEEDEDLPPSGAYDYFDDTNSF